MKPHIRWHPEFDKWECAFAKIGDECPKCGRSKYAHGVHMYSGKADCGFQAMDPVEFEVSITKQAAMKLGAACAEVYEEAIHKLLAANLDKIGED